jgi:methyl-accepting chemotaxis protein
MGADWSNAILSGIANGGDFDFSSLFAELSPSEITSIKDMSATDLGKLFGLSSEEITALGFTNAKEFKEAFVEGLSEYDEEDAKNALDLQYESEAEGLGIDKEEFKSYRELLKANEDIAKAYEDNYEGLNKVAVANKRMEKGVKTLADDWEDYNDVMSDSTSTAADISSVMPGIKKGL